MGLLDSIGKAAKTVAGFTPLGALVNNTLEQGENTPQLQIADVDSGTEDLIKQREALANKSLEQISAERTAGIDRSRDLGAIQGGMGIQNSNLMGSSQPPGVQEALKRRADKGYAQSLTKIQNQSRLDAASEKMRARQQALQARMQQAQSKANILHAQDMEQYNNRAARNAALAGLLGGAGSVVGGIFGGQSGAQLGGKAGGAVPNQKYQTADNSSYENMMA